MSRVEIAGRLIGEEHLRTVDKRAGDRYTLLFTSRELGGPVMEAACQAHLLEQLGGAPFHFTLR